MKSGIELISDERREQIVKHGFLLVMDERYTSGELAEAAMFSEAATGHGIGWNGDGLKANWPKGWANYYRQKILMKSKKEALIVAGAFYLAENDRLGEDRYKTKIDSIAAEIDRLQAI